MSDLKQYSKATREELIEADVFRRWVYASAPADEQRWQKYLSNYPEQQTVVTEARNFLLAFREVYDQQPATEAELSADRKQVGRKVRQRRLLRRRRRQIFAAAAAVLLLLGVLALWPDASVTNGQPALATVTTTSGENETVVLPDGSRVELNANSSLTYDPEWDGRSDRKVQLTGEAFFSVTSQPTTGAKFTVVTDDLAVRVLGTRFNVNAYFAATEVVLNEGRVELLSPDAEPLLARPLAPGERATYDATLGDLRQSTVDTLAYTGWKDGEYIFEDIPLGEIVDKLSVVYGVDFEFSSEDLRNVRVSTSASAENLDEFIQVLNLLFSGDSIRVVRKGDLVTVVQAE